MDNKITDWECLECDGRGSRSSDCNIDSASVKLRHMERLGLQGLPFLSEAQAKRLVKLEALRKRDNSRIKRQLLSGARLQSY